MTKTAPQGAVFGLRTSLCYNARPMANKLILGALALLIILAGGWWYMTQRDVFSVVSGDSIQSWDFQGSYKDGGANEKKARDEIARLEEGLKDAAVEPTDYILYVGIANQYVLLGDGKSAFKNLNKALAIDSEKTGLAWHNMGVLMERLGAINTARIAFSRAVDAQPHIDMYHTAYLAFLTKYFSEDKELVEAAFKRSQEQFGDAAPTVPLMAAWLEEQGRNAEAEELQKKMEARMKSGPPQESVIIE